MVPAVNRITEVRLLPPGCGLTDEGHSRQQGSGTAPEAARMDAGVVRALVKADASDGTVHVRTELHAQLDRCCIPVINRCWYCIPENILDNASQ